MSNPRLYQLNTQTGTLVLTGANIGLNVVHNAVFSSNVGIGTTTKSVKYSILYMKAVKALQEAMARIESLEAKVASLESAS